MSRNWWNCSEFQECLPCLWSNLPLKLSIIVLQFKWVLSHFEGISFFKFFSHRNSKRFKFFWHLYSYKYQEYTISQFLCQLISPVLFICWSVTFTFPIWLYPIDTCGYVASGPNSRSNDFWVKWTSSLYSRNSPPRDLRSIAMRSHSWLPLL